MTLETKVKDITRQVKDIAHENGATLVGIASRDRLVAAPPSADPDYLLPSTRSIISIAIPLDRGLIRDFLRKKDWLGHSNNEKQIQKKLHIIIDHLAEFLKARGFESRAVDANGVYRPEPSGTDVINRVAMVPDFSHRYGAVAAGLGQPGWSGNLMTPQFGSAVLLASVLTSAELAADPVLETNPCDKCKLCTTVCPVEMIGKKQSVAVTIAGREYTYAKKGHYVRCRIGCGGFHGLGPKKQWSTWSPYRVQYPLPEDEAELIALNRQIRAADPTMQGSRAFLTQRDKCFDPDEIYFLTCANCQLICWENRDDRVENQRLLVNSGVVVLSAKSGRTVVPSEEAVEIDTKYRLKLAVPHGEYRTIAVLRKADMSEGKVGIDRSYMDVEVLSHITDKKD